MKHFNHTGSFQIRLHTPELAQGLVRSEQEERKIELDLQVVWASSVIRDRVNSYC